MGRPLCIHMRKDEAALVLLEDDPSSLEGTGQRMPSADEQPMLMLLLPPPKMVEWLPGSFSLPVWKMIHRSCSEFLMRSRLT